MSGATIRAKMFVNTVSRVQRAWDHNSDHVEVQEDVVLHAVTSSKKESANAEWSKATPCGELKLSISNPGAHGRLKPGMFVYVDLIPCEKDSA